MDASTAERANYRPRLLIERVLARYLLVFIHELRAPCAAPTLKHGGGRGAVFTLFGFYPFDCEVGVCGVFFCDYFVHDINPSHELFCGMKRTAE